MLIFNNFSYCVVLLYIIDCICVCAVLLYSVINDDDDDDDDE